MPGPHLVAAFTSDTGALMCAFTATTNADEDAQLAREQRDDIFDPIRAHLTPLPGSTPAPVQLSITWDVPRSKAHLVWSESDNPNVANYSVRYHPCPVYKASEEQTVSSVPAGMEEFFTDIGLPAPGSTAWFNVYVVMTTGNAKGSNAVKIIRP